MQSFPRTFAAKKHEPTIISASVILPDEQAMGVENLCLHDPVQVSPTRNPRVQGLEEMNSKYIMTIDEHNILPPRDRYVSQ